MVIFAKSTHTHPMSDDTQSPNGHSRRTFLIGACTLAAAGITGAVLISPAEAATGVQTISSGKVKVTVAKIKALRKDGGVALIGMVGEAQTAVLRVNATTYVALDLSCPHAGVTVKRSSSGWSCPAHGSQFGTDGQLKKGPARHPLAKFKTTFSGGVLTIG